MKKIILSILFCIMSVGLYWGYQNIKQEMGFLGGVVSELKIKGEVQEATDKLETLNSALAQAQVLKHETKLENAKVPAVVATKSSDKVQALKTSLGEKPELEHDREKYIDWVEKSIEGIQALSEEIQDTPEVEEVLFEALSVEDHLIQSEAIKVMGKLPPSEKKLIKLAEVLEASAHLEPFEEGLKELERYSSSNSDKVTGVILKVLQEGGHYVGIETAQKSLDFMSEDNIGQFEKILDYLPAESKKRQYLEWNIKEFKKMQSQG